MREFNELPDQMFKVEFSDIEEREAFMQHLAENGYIYHGIRHPRFIFVTPENKSIYPILHGFMTFDVYWHVVYKPRSLLTIIKNLLKKSN